MSCEDALASQGVQAAGAGGLYPSAECGRFVLYSIAPLLDHDPRARHPKNRTSPFTPKHPTNRAAAIMDVKELSPHVWEGRHIELDQDDDLVGLYTLRVAK
jgi:hypothetical protein